MDDSVMELKAGERTFDVVHCIPRKVCERHLCVPIVWTGSALKIVMVDATNQEAIRDIEFLTGLPVEAAGGYKKKAILAHIIKRYGPAAPAEGSDSGYRVTCGYCATVYAGRDHHSCPHCGAPQAG